MLSNKTHKIRWILTLSILCVFTIGQLSFLTHIIVAQYKPCCAYVASLNAKKNIKQSFADVSGKKDTLCCAKPDLLTRLHVHSIFLTQQHPIQIQNKPQIDIVSVGIFQNTLWIGETLVPIQAQKTFLLAPKQSPPVLEQFLKPITDCFCTYKEGSSSTYILCLALWLWQ